LFTLYFELVIADGNTRAIDALLRLCFRNIPPACSVQWSLTSKNDNISSNWLQLSSVKDQKIQDKKVQLKNKF
jgi:hypothetical protein